MRELERVYEAARGRIVDLVAPLEEEAATVEVPTCPGWSVQDLLAHLTGICTNTLRGEVAGAATDEWTAAQVAERRDWKLGDVLAEWDTVGPQIAAMLDGFPGRLGHQVVTDAAVHEHDIRAALGRPGQRSSDAVAIGTDFLVGMMLHIGAVVAGIGPLEVLAGDRTWVLGTGDPPTGDRDGWLERVVNDDVAAPTRPPVGSVTAPPFELFRAAAGRRSAGQVRSFEWTVEPEPFLAIFDTGPFTIRPADLEE